MELYEEVLAKSNIDIMIEKLDQWNDKKPLPELMELKEGLLESRLFFIDQEKELRTARQRSGDLEIKILELQRELETIKNINSGI